jgi:hypothetical protein
MAKDNKVSSAFKEGFNTIGLAAVVAISAALLTPIPLLAGLVAEAAYLLFVPDSKWYEARLSKRYDAEVETRRQKLKDQVLPTLRPEMQQRFSRLESMRLQIGTQGADDATWFREVLRKLDYLLEKFLLFASKDAQYRSYVRSVRDELDTTNQQPARAMPPVQRIDVRDRRAGARQQQPSAPPYIPPVDSSDQWVQRATGEIVAWFDQELAEVAESLAKEQDEDTKAVLEKRKDVLERRREFMGKITKILTNLNHQLELVQDTFGLINDEIRARSPEQILADIEDVVYQTDTMTTLLDEVAPFEQMSARLGV